MLKPDWNGYKVPAKDRWRRQYNLPRHEEWPELYDFHPGEHWDHDLFLGKDLYVLKDPLPEAPMPWDDNFGDWSPEEWTDVEIRELNARLRNIKRERCKAAHPARFNRKVA